MESQSAWADRLAKVLIDAEDAERQLSYLSSCGSERARKLTGSYYTPVDVSRYFWNEFFRLRGIVDSKAAMHFVKSHRFIEPSVGAGALFFGLLERLIASGMQPADLTCIRADLVDLNYQALDFVRTQMSKLESYEDISFSGINYVHSDFLACDYSESETPLMVFGNPPFVANEKGSSSWKNSFADFLDRALGAVGTSGSIHFIVPMSIAFSRDYALLRENLIADERIVALSHFDNIPDTLFKSGKPKHENTNKANSQRCSILSSMPSQNARVLSTKLNRWSKKIRQDFLRAPAQYLDVTEYGFDDQVPRPANETILRYMDLKSHGSRVSTVADLVDSNGRYSLHISGVARNYIGIRDCGGSSVNTLNFSNRNDFLCVLGLITSDLFFDYWLTIGDGFHVTRSNIMNFPVRDELLRKLNENLPCISKMWKSKKRYAKFKLNSGRETSSFDFSGVSKSLYSALEVIELPVD